MTTTTTLKLPDELKQRIAAAADNAGVSPHAFMVEALEAGTRRAELRASFVESALKAEQEIAIDGEVYAMDAVHKHFHDRLADGKARGSSRLKPLNTTGSGKAAAKKPRN